MNGKYKHILSHLKVFYPLIIVLLFEIFVFNFPFWNTLGNTPAIAAVGEGQGITQTSDGLWKVHNADNPYLTVKLKRPIEVSYFKARISDSTAPKGRFHAGRSFFIEPYVKDAGNRGLATPLGRATVTENLPDTHYVRLHAVGTLTKLNLKFDGLKVGDTFALSNVELNPRRPLHFSILRFLTFIVCVYTVYIFAPSSRIYYWKLNLSSRKQMFFAAFAAVLSCVILYCISRLIQPGRIFAGTYMTENGGIINDDNQYNHVANAIINGHTYLDLPVPEWLKDMANPYDAGMRLQYGQKTGQPSYWDYAFYKGKYYSYFGVLPALLSFVPFKLITGKDLRTDYAVVFFATLFVLAAFYFCYSFIKKYFRNTSFGMYLLSSIAIVIGASGITQVFLPKIYSLPMLSSLFLTLLGLALWITAFNEKTRFTKLHLIGGALSIALNLGCRPLFVLAAFFAFPIFSQQIKERKFFSLSGLTNTLSVIVPFFIVGIPTMWYNKIRFASYFDFGATYNLTGFDMVHHAKTMIRIPIGLWFYLVQPLHISANYPYIFTVDEPHGFMGRFIMEPYYGGFFIFTPIALAIFLAIPFKTLIKKYKIRFILCMAVCFSVFYIIADSMITGVNSRYYGDFGWLLVFGSFLVVFGLLDQWTRIDVQTNRIVYSPRAKWLKNAVIVAVGWMALLYLINLFSDGRYGNLVATNNTVYRIVESWLVAFQ